MIRTLLATAALLAVAATAGAAPITIIAADNSFTPAVITVHGGDTVTWTNAGINAHTVTNYTGGIGVYFNRTLQPGQTFTINIPAGTTVNLKYFCRFHYGLGMTGQLQIRP
jgi:plastocyanin